MAIEVTFEEFIEVTFEESIEVTFEDSIEVTFEVQSGEDAEDALSLEVTLRKRALELVALLQKETCN